VKENLTFSAINSKAPTAYPITYQTWVVVYAKQTDAARARRETYLRFLLGDAQKQLKDLDFAPLPRSLQEKAQKQVDRIAVPLACSTSVARRRRRSCVPLARRRGGGLVLLVLG